jgi:hypothetical protein
MLSIPGRGFGSSSASVVVVAYVSSCLRTVDRSTVHCLEFNWMLGTRRTMLFVGAKAELNSGNSDAARMIHKLNFIIELGCQIVGLSRADK